MSTLRGLTFRGRRVTIRILLVNTNERAGKCVELLKLLEIEPGVTAIIGGGGKTTLLYALAREAARDARVIVCTTTHILPPEHLPCVLSESEDEIAAALCKTNCVCVGTKSAEGKFSAPAVPMERLMTLARYVFVEADGSKHRPLKAHAGHEPVIPAEANQTILVLGASGLNQPICDAAHRPELYARKLGVSEDDLATPYLAAKLLELEALHTRVLVNQVETEAALANARELAGFLHSPVAAGSLWKENIVCLC